MEPSLSSDTRDLEEVLHIFQKSVENNSISLFKTPTRSVKAAPKRTLQKKRIYKKTENSQKLLDNVPGHNIRRTRVVNSHNKLTSDASYEINPTRKACPINLPECATMKSKINDEMLYDPFPSCIETSKTRVSNAAFLLNKDHKLARGKPEVRKDPAQPSPNSSLAISSTSKHQFGKKTKITISLPPLSNETENQLITVFFHISKLHGCKISVDRMKKEETSMRNEVNLTNMASRYPAFSQQLAVAAQNQRRKSQKATQKQKMSASSQLASKLSLSSLQSKLNSLGTQLEVVQPQPHQQLQQSQEGSSGSSELLFIYPEVVMKALQ